MFKKIALSAALLALFGTAHAYQAEINAGYENTDIENIKKEYHHNLYRKEGFNPYTDATTKENFLARIEKVEPDGKLILITEKGERKEYYFKEVIYS